MILLDASGLLSAIDAAQPRHHEVRLALEAESPPYIVSPFVLAEVDYLIVRDAGVDAELQLLRGVANRTYELTSFEPEDVGAALDVISRYRDSESALQMLRLSSLRNDVGPTACSRWTSGTFAC